MNDTSTSDTLNRLANKLDMLIDSLPQRYVPRTDFDPWKVGVESRLKTLEDNQGQIRETIHIRWEEGAKFTRQTLKEIDQQIHTTERTLLDKLQETEDKMEQSNDSAFNKRVVVFSLIFGAAGTAVSVLGFFTLHFH